MSYDDSTEIRVNLPEIEELVLSLHVISQGINEIVEHMEKVRENISSSWKGEAAKNYQETQKKLEKDLTTTYQEICNHKAEIEHAIACYNEAIEIERIYVS